MFDMDKVKTGIVCSTSAAHAETAEQEGVELGHNEVRMGFIGTPERGTGPGNRRERVHTLDGMKVAGNSRRAEKA